MEYSVGTKNKFELFDLDVEDPDFIHIKTKKNHPKSAQTTDTKKPLQQKSNEKNKTVTVKVANVSNAKTTAVQNRSNDVKSVRTNDNRDSNRRQEKGGRQEKRTDAGKPRKREFDRRSGSDKSSVKPTEKREGFGKSNWGNFSEDVEVQNETIEQTTNNANEDGELNHANEEIENVEPTEEEPKVLTLEEYRKQEKEKRLVPKYNIRKPGEGDTQQWKKGYVLKKDKDEEEEVFVYEEIEVEETKQGKHKKVLDIDITFREDRKNGYGGFRGNRPRKDREGGDRPYRERQPREDRDGDRPPREDRPPRRNTDGEGNQEQEDRQRGERRDRRNNQSNNTEGDEQRTHDDRPRGERGDRPRGERSDRPPRDRDDRGGPRRSGGFRKGGKQAAPKLDDENFPGLGLAKVES